MDIKKVIPVVKPLGTTTPQTVKPVVTPVVAVKPVVTSAPKIEEVPKVEAEMFPPATGLFAQPSVAEVSKTERLEDIKKAVGKVTNKSTGDSEDEETDDADEGTSKKTKKKETKVKFKVPLKVRVYDREVFVVENPDMTEEQIRLKVVEELNFFEFSKERTKFIYNEALDQVVLKANFEKRG